MSEQQNYRSENYRSESVRPDEVLPPGRSIQGRRLIQDSVFLIPNFVKLVSRLLRDPRVPRRSKIALGAAAAYVASPVDLVPEFIPVIGFADDVIFLMMALHALMARTGTEIVEEHWDGPVDLLNLVEDVLGFARAAVPKKLRNLFDRVSG